MWVIGYTNDAKRDFKLLRRDKHIQEIVSTIIDELRNNPFNNCKSTEKLGSRRNKKYYSKRITLKHRLVYEVSKDTKEVIVHSMWSHYE